MDQLFISNSYALFQGRFFDNKEHSHHAIQLCAGLEGDLKIESGRECFKGKMFLLGPDHPHKIGSQKGELLLLFLDPETPPGKRVKEKYLTSQKIQSLTYPIPKEALTTTPANIPILVNGLLAETEITSYREMDKRIEKIQAIIETVDYKKIEISQLSRQAGLSESRLQHLFKEETGVSIKRYLLWKRLVDGIRILKQSSDLTRAAYDAGFSDSAHFSRTFKAMFGVTLKELFKTRSGVKVHFLPPDQ